MNIIRIMAIILRQFYLIRASVGRLVPLVVWVAIDVLLWGFITRYLETVTTPTLNLTTGLLGGVVFWGFFVRVKQGVTMTFFEEVWARNFLNMFASPILMREYLTGMVLTSVCTAFFGLCTMLLIAIGVFDVSFLSYGVMIVPFMLVLFLFGIALGIVGNAIVLRLGPSAEWLVWPIPALLSPFAAVFYPLSTLPVWMQDVARALPPVYVFENLRAIAAGQPASWTDLAIGAALATGYIVLACWIFIRTYRNVVRSGLLSRYSAESVN